MKTLLFLSFFLLTTFAFSQVTQTISILPESKIYLNGVSNINEFSCVVRNNNQPEKLDLCYTKDEDQLIFDDNRYAISVARFDCENRHMTRDLKETLKMEEHPYIYLELKSLEEISLTDKTNQATLKITIAGKPNEYCLPYKVERLDQNIYRVDLESDFNMRDFDIEPPTALMGLIKVKEKISIRLNLLVKLNGD